MKRQNTGLFCTGEKQNIFTYVKGSPVCLVCGANVVITKEYNTKRHYKTKHQDMYKDLDMTQKCLGFKTDYIQKSHITEGAIKASFIVAAKIAKSAWPFNEKEFVKKCMLKVCDLVRPKKMQVFSDVTLSRNTVADCTCKLATNLYNQLMEKRKDFLEFLLLLMRSAMHLILLNWKSLSVEWTQTCVLWRNFWD